MKKTIICLVAASLLLGFTSCSEEAKVEKAAKQFVTALNTGDTNAILANYPAAEGATLQNYFLPDNVKVAWNENDSIYTLTFDEGIYALARWIKEEKRLEIFNSKNLMPYNSYRLEYLHQGGFDTSELMDLELKSVVDDDDYISFIYNKFESALTGNLTVDIKMMRLLSSTFADYTIKNNGDVDVPKGSYQMEIEYLDAEGNTLNTAEAEEFKYSHAIRAHQNYGSTAEVFGSFEDDIASARGHFYFHLGDDDMIMTYATFSGNEYQEYKTSKEAE